MAGYGRCVSSALAQEHEFQISTTAVRRPADLVRCTSINTEFDVCCQSLTEDVARQMERERELQKRFADLQQQKDDISELLNQ